MKQLRDNKKAVGFMETKIVSMTGVLQGVNTDYLSRKNGGESVKTCDLGRRG